MNYEIGEDIGDYDEYEDNESWHSSDNGSVVWDSEGDEHEKDETEEKNQLIDQKFKLVIFFNEGTIDIDEFNFKMKKINDSLADLTFINDYYNNSLLEKEDTFVSRLNTYSSDIRRNRTPNFLSEQEVKSLYKTYESIKELREKCMKKEITESKEPLESKSFDQRLQDLIKDEQSYLRKVAKDVFQKGLTKELIKEPSRNSFPKTTMGNNEYYHAYDRYIREISKFIDPIKYVQNMNITSIGSSFEKYQKTLREKVLEEKQFASQLPIIVGDKEKIFFQNRNVLKNIMMKLNVNKLIECAINAESYYIIEDNEKKSEVLLTKHTSGKQIINKNLLGTGMYKFTPSAIQNIQKYNALQKKNVRGVITKTLRIDSAKKLLKKINTKYMIMVEREIHKLSNNNKTVYINKINDILFILERYPHFKFMDISPAQFALFEKEIAFEIVVGVTSVTNRRLTINILKKALMKNTLYKGIVKNYMSNVYAKRLELLIYDISKNTQTYEYYTKKLLNYIHKNPNRIFRERKEKVSLFLQLRLRKNQDTVKPEKPEKPEKPVKINSEDQTLSSNNDIPITIEKINEVVQAYKRKLMIDSLQIPYESKNKLIGLLEIMDMNNLLNKSAKVQTKIAPTIVQLLPYGYIFIEFNNYYYNESFKKIDSMFEKLPNGRYTIHSSQKIPDYYGNNLLEVILRTRDPINFYPPTIQKEYNKLLESVKPKPKQEFKTLRIFYNPYTGTFGDHSS